MNYGSATNIFFLLRPFVLQNVLTNYLTNTTHNKPEIKFNPDGKRSE
jgi:hypothetical protein